MNKEIANWLQVNNIELIDEGTSIRANLRSQEGEILESHFIKKTTEKTKMNKGVLDYSTKKQAVEEVCNQVGILSYWDIQALKKIKRIMS